MTFWYFFLLQQFSFKYRSCQRLYSSAIRSRIRSIGLLSIPPMAMHAYVTNAEVNSWPAIAPATLIIDQIHSTCVEPRYKADSLMEMCIVLASISTIAFYIPVVTVCPSWASHDKLRIETAPEIHTIVRELQVITLYISVLILSVWYHRLKCDHGAPNSVLLFWYGLKLRNWTQHLWQFKWIGKASYGLIWKCTE